MTALGFVQKIYAAITSTGSGTLAISKGLQKETLLQLSSLRNLYLILTRLQPFVDLSSKEYINIYIIRSFFLFNETNIFFLDNNNNLKVCLDISLNLVSVEICLECKLLFLSLPVLMGKSLIEEVNALKFYFDFFRRKFLIRILRVYLQLVQQVPQHPCHQFQQPLKKLGPALPFNRMSHGIGRQDTTASLNMPNFASFQVDGFWRNETDILSSVELLAWLILGAHISIPTVTTAT